LTAYKKSPLLYPILPSQTPTIYRLATLPRDLHCIVRYDLLRSSKVNDFHLI